MSFVAVSARQISNATSGEYKARARNVDALDGVKTAVIDANHASHQSESTRRVGG